MGFQDWVCPSCWLRCPRAPEPHGEIARADFGFEVLQQVMVIRSAARAAARDEPEPKEKGQVPPEKIVDQPWPHERLHVIWDATGRNAAALARLLYDEFGAFLTFAELHDEAAVAALLCKFPDVPRGEVVRECGLSAILPDGIFISGCEDCPRVLLYEITYVATVAPPRALELCRFRGDVLDALARVRERRAEGAAEPGETSRWWLEPEALSIILGSLEEHKMCIVDGFLDAEELRALQDTACSLRSGRHLERGIVEQRSSEHRYFGEERENRGDFLNVADKPRKWTVQGDQRIWIKDSDARAPKLRILTAALDRLIAGLRRGESAAARRVRRISFRENTMVACYSGAARGRYMKHSDTGRKAVMTAILYLNDDWRPEDGGSLRLFHHECQTRVRCDVEPLANRLLLFWATDECPHEVRAAHRDRYAMTTWFLDGRQHLNVGGEANDGSSTRLNNLLQNANVVECESDSECLGEDEAGGASLPGRGAVDADMVRKLRIALGRQARAEEAARRRNCAGCGAAPPASSLPGTAELSEAAVSLALRGAGAARGLGAGDGGRVGEGEYEDSWYCKACWDKWDQECQEKERQSRKQDELRALQQAAWRGRYAEGS